MRSKPVQHLDYFILALLAFISYVVFFHGLGGIGLLGPDEPRYAGVAREMYQSGEYVTPRLQGEDWFEKPVLFYWLAALGFAVFSVGETAARLPSAVAATVSVFMIYWCGYRVWSRGRGLAAALILATSAGFLGLARAASMDMLLTSALASALALFLVGYESEGSVRRSCFYGFYAALGIGALAKGPVAFLLPMLSLGVFLFWRGSPGEWKRWHPEGVLLAALVAAPWYVAVWWVNGWAFIEEFLLNHNVLRFASDLYQHEQPFYFYVPVALVMMFPWTFLLIPALRRPRFAKNEYLLLSWALVPLVFFSLSGSKLPAYILPLTAPVALLSAGEIASRETRTGAYRLAVLLEAAFWIAVGAVFGFFPDAVAFDVPVGGPVFFASMGGVALAVLVIGFWLPPSTLAAFNVVSVLVLVVLITTAVFPRVQSVESMRPWRDELSRLVSGEEEVVLYRPARWMEYGLEFYRDQPIRTVHSEEELAEIADSASRTLCIASTAVLDELSAGTSVAIDVVSSLGNQSAFWIYHP